MPAVKRGTRTELDVETLADDGTAVAHVDGIPVHVEDAVPGDRVKA
jgi:predicted RNA-binding protein with TRAM domain